MIGAIGGSSAIGDSKTPVSWSSCSDFTASAVPQHYLINPRRIAKGIETYPAKTSQARV